MVGSETWRIAGDDDAPNSEAFGFSNDAMGRFGPPSFELAKFELTSELRQIEIHTK